MRHHIALATTLAIASLSQPTLAQEEGVALNQFNPSWAGDRFFGTRSAGAYGHKTLHAGIMLDYAHNPLVLRRIQDDGTETLVGTVVSSQMFLHLNASYALWNRLTVNINVPLALLQDGDDPQVGSTTFASPSGVALGDVRVGARYSLLRHKDRIYELAVGAEVFVPTGPGDDGSFTGTGSVRGLPQAMVDGQIGGFIYAANAGVLIARQSQYLSTTQGTNFKWNAAAGYLLGPQQNIQVGVEGNGGFVLEDVQRRTVNLELLAGAKYRFLNNFVVGAAGGPGLSRGVGTPDARAVLSVMYTPDQRQPADSDGDGIIDKVDACPKVKGVKSTDPAKHGCPPPPDSDGDGIIDELDACPAEPGVPNADKTKHGCPPPKDTDGDGITDDKDACVTVPGQPNSDPKQNGCPPPDSDGDGILDKDDACPKEKGVANADKSKHGCPLPKDSDGDGIIDELDACPKQAGKANEDPKKNGCPVVVVTKKEIKIMQRIEFALDRATIKKESMSIVEAVAGILKQFKDIELIEVQGHTDNQGAAYYNRSLSSRRAKAVVKALTKLGVEAKRLKAKGFGPDKPIADNKTKEGRQTNRRVQFVILKRAKSATTEVKTK